MPPLAIVLLIGITLTVGQLWWSNHSRARSIGMICAFMLTVIASVTTLGIHKAESEHDACERQRIEEHVYKHDPTP